MSEIIPSPNAHLRIWSQFANADYRHAYVEGHSGDFLASQIHAMRVTQGWTQAELAERAGVTQPQISSWENSCEAVNIASMHKLAEAFDVALLTKFVPFSVIVREILGAQADLPVPSYGDESPQAVSFPKVSIKMGEEKLRPPSPRNGEGRNNSYLKEFDKAGTLPTVAL